MFKRKWLLVWISLVLLTVGMYYGYLSDERLFHKGRYSIANVEKTRLARNGIRVWWNFVYKGARYYKDGVHPIPEIRLEDVGKRYFIIFLPDAPNGHSIMTKYLVPDSIQSAPDTGWSREWMIAHFPNVITR